MLHYIIVTLSLVNKASDGICILFLILASINELEWPKHCLSSNNTNGLQCLHVYQPFCFRVYSIFFLLFVIQECVIFTHWV